MAPLASLLLGLLLPLSRAQGLPSLCGQTKTSQTQAFNDCCPSFDGATDTFSGVTYKYHCNSKLSWPPRGRPEMDPGACAEACSKDKSCVGATWDSALGATSCWFTMLLSKPGSMALEVAIPPPPDCSSQVASAVSSAVASAQSAAQVSCQSQVAAAASSAAANAQSAASSACNANVASAVSSAQSAAETSCQSQIASVRSDFKTGCHSKREMYTHDGQSATQYPSCRIQNIPDGGRYLGQCG